MSTFRVACLTLGLMTSASGAPAQLGDARTPTEVLDRMSWIQPSRYTPEDGIARFNALYFATTRNVVAAVEAGRFEDTDAMRAFLVDFANHYFRALDAFSVGRIYPRAWAPLFSRHGLQERHRPIRFALAGMHAHISHDLPLVVMEMFRGRSEFPSSLSREHRDYQRINAILDETYRQERAWLGDGVGSPDDRVVLAGIRALRGAAWGNGFKLWRVRDHAAALRAQERLLDQATFVGAEAVFRLGELASPIP